MPYKVLCIPGPNSHHNAYSILDSMPVRISNKGSETQSSSIWDSFDLFSFGASIHVFDVRIEGEGGQKIPHICGQTVHKIWTKGGGGSKKNQEI